MEINYGKLQDFIVTSRPSLYPVLRVNECKGLSLQTITHTNILRRLLGNAVWHESAEPNCPAVGDLTAQRAVRKNKGIDSGEFFSKKLQRFVQYESGVERNFFTLLEGSIDVLWYLEQPLRISYLKDGENAIYVPDVLLCLAPDRYAVVEIKPAATMLDKANVDKFLALQAHCDLMGWGLLVTDGQYALPELAGRKLKKAYVSEVRARLQDAPMSHADYKDVEKYYRASKMDFAALLVQEEIEHTIRPFQLAAKSKKARVRQVYLAK